MAILLYAIVYYEYVAVIRCGIKPELGGKCGNVGKGVIFEKFVKNMTFDPKFLFKYFLCRA
jgi:hypothetical protein